MPLVSRPVREWKAMHIFTELVAIQMLLMDTLEPLVRGDKMATDQVKTLYRLVQSTKAAKAQELLEKRAKQRAEETSWTNK